MKSVTIILSILLLGCVIYIFRQANAVRYTNDRIDEIYDEARRLEHQKDSADNRILFLEEQISIMDQVLQNRELEAIRAKEGEAAMRKKYESEKFKNYTSDSAILEFKKLYKSWK